MRSPDKKIGMRRLFAVLSALAAVFCANANAQNVKTLDDYQSLNFYGIDFALTQVVGAEETPGAFIDAFYEINQLFLSEAEKYVTPLANRLKKKIDRVDLDAVIEQIRTIDATELKVNHTADSLSRDDVLAELQELEIKRTEGLGLVVMADELNKGTECGSYCYVFFDNMTMDIIDIWPFKGASGGMGLRNYWARSFYRTIAEINPSSFYQSAKKIKASVSRKQ